MLCSRQILWKQCGSALVIVLWLVMLMTAVAAVTARMTLLDGRVSQLAVERIRCRWAGRAGVETARALLLTDERLSDTNMDLWSRNETELVEVPLDNCRFTAQVIDEASKLDINQITDAQLACLPDMREDILNSILDWRDSDDQVRSDGAEAGYYLTLPNGYYCRNGSLETIRELLRVKGVTKDIFYGPSSQMASWSQNEGWINYLTCHSLAPNIDGQGNARVNVNQADRQELTNTLGLSDEQAQWVLNNRPFQTLVSLTQTGSTAGSGTTGTGSSVSGSVNIRSGGSSTTGRAGGGEAGVSSGGSRGGGSSGRSAGRGAGRSGSSQGGGSAGRQASGTGSGASARTGGPAGGSSSRQSGTALSWNTALSKEDQIAFDAQPFVKGRVNVNTAGLIVLETLLEGNRQLAENIIAYREGLGSGFETLEQLSRVEGMTESILKGIIDRLTVRSSVFQIRSTAVSDATGQTYVVEVILNRDDRNGRILYWREQ